MIRWLALGLLLLAPAAAETVTLSGRTMGTTWRATLLLPAGGGERDDLERRMAARLEELEAIFSLYRADSALARFNATAGTAWTPVPAELAVVARDSARLSELTDGAFDATVAPLLAVWGFGPAGGAGRMPHPDELAVARRNVGWTLLETRSDPPALRKTRPGVAADFSSMAKGYAVEEMSAVLRARGVTRHLVQIGGDLKSLGDGGTGSGWKVGIERPGAPAATVATTLRLRDGRALSTSGDANNSVVVHGERIGHILDPRTGRPVSTAVASASVVHESAAMASALATALFVLGADEGLRLAAAEGWAVLFLVREGGELRELASPALAAWR